MPRESGASSTHRSRICLKNLRLLDGPLSRAMTTDSHYLCHSHNLPDVASLIRATASHPRKLLPQQARLAAVVAFDAARAIEDEGRPRGLVIGGPRGNGRIVRLAGARERGPGGRHAARKIMRHRAAVGRSDQIDGVEDERHVEG